MAAPKEQARLFVLVRGEDVSGVSGTGVIADGVVFDDGLAILHWRGKVRSTAMYPSLETLVEIHGHDGKTVVRWSDGPIVS